MKQIAIQFLKGLGGIFDETGEKMTDESKNLFENVISGKELLGNIKPMSDEELHQKQVEDEKKKQEEINKLKGQMAEQGRNVEGEIEKVREEKEREEEEEKKVEMEKLKQQEEAEEQERNTVLIEPVGKPKQGSAMAKGKNGKASQSDMSVTAEYGKKPD